MTDEELSTLADSWIRFHLSPRKSQKEADAWAADTHDLEHHDPETLWRLIPIILQKDSSLWIKAVLSAGPVENLLVLHGPKFIDRVEAAARKDPTFAHMLGGVWHADINEEVWNRIQRVCNKEGWDIAAQRAS
jgi:hypothetical protein